MQSFILLVWLLVCAAQDARQRGLAVQLHWPNTVQFQRLLQERYDASLAAVQD